MGQGKRTGTVNKTQERKTFKLEKNRTNQVQQLRDELTKAEEDLKEALARESRMRTELDEMREIVEKAAEEKKAALRDQEIKLYVEIIRSKREKLGRMIRRKSRDWKRRREPRH